MLPICFCESSYPIAKLNVLVTSHAFIKKGKEMFNIIIPMSIPIYSYKCSNENKSLWLAFSRSFPIEI